MAGQDVLNPLDPDYKIKLIMGLKDKGFSYASIAKAMEMAGVDGKIARAQEEQNNQKANAVRQNFFQAMQNGDQAGMLYSLGQLASLDKGAAAMYAAATPSAKDVWNLKNKREDAKTTFGYQQALMKQKQDYAQANARLNTQLKVAANAESLQQKAAIEQQAKRQWAEDMLRMGATPEQVRNTLLGMNGRSSSGGRSNANAATYKDASGITYDGDGNIVSYDKDTQKLYQELLDAVKEFGYDVDKLTGKGDEADVNGRSDTGDKMEDINKKLAMIKGRISDEDYENLLSDAYAIGKKRQAIYGGSLEFH